MVNKLFQQSVVFLLISIALIATLIEPAEAALPPGNAVKDPYEILRNALPIQQKELREIQHKLEDTNDAVRRNQWPAVSKAVSSAQFRVSNQKNEILNTIPSNQRNKAENILIELKTRLNNLNELANNKNKGKFLDERSKSLQEIGELEALVLGDKFPYTIPKEFDKLPRLLGRASVSINTSKGNMQAIIDGYNAPLTGGAFIDLALKGFYDELPINRAEEFFVLQTGDPKGDQTGYLDPQTNEERHVPLEIRVRNQTETIYNHTFEELGLYTETPVLPFSTPGALGWSHSGNALDDGSSQFFFFLYDAELNPAGRNLIDGNNAAFGYVVEGTEILNKLDVNDQILSIKVNDGADRLLANG